MRRGRWFVGAARAAGMAVGGIAVIALVGAVMLRRDPLPLIEARRSHLVSAERTPAPPPVAPAIATSGFPGPSAPDTTPAHDVEHVELRAASGLTVELAIKRPRTADMHCTDGDRRSLVLLLGGHRTGRNAVHLVHDTRGTIVAALSYPFAGNHRVKGPAIVGEVPAMRRAVFDTPAALLLALDHLLADPCVDPARVEIVGVSLGAPFVIIAGALDNRITRVWSVHGTGGIYEPLEFNLRRQVGPRVFSVPLAALSATLLAGERLAPERWVSRIAPRPIVMINALDDQRLPRPAVERLHAAAHEPKELIWMEGMHVRSESEAVRPLIDLVLTRITAGGPRY